MATFREALWRYDFTGGKADGTTARYLRTTAATESGSHSLSRLTRLFSFVTMGKIVPGAEPELEPEKYSGRFRFGTSIWPAEKPGKPWRD